MTLELDAVAGPSADRSLAWDEEPDHRRPNVAGDLPTVLQAAPMFGRAVAGYDRFQVDTYVRWAEDELAAADRERERLLTRTQRTQAALDEARRLLAHSPGGGELMRVSRRIGAMLADAADQAEDIRAEARAELSAASTEARRRLAEAAAALAAAEDEAARLTTDAARAAALAAAEGDRVLEAARAERDRADVEVQARLAEVRLLEQRAAADAERVGDEAAAEAAATLLRARAEVVAMLGTGRELRRRADDEAAATRDRLDREAARRRAVLLAEVAALSERRAELRAGSRVEVGTPAGPGSTPPRSRLGSALRQVHDRRRPRSGAHRTP